MKTKIILSYEWRDENGNPPSTEIYQQLDEIAEREIFSKIKEGFTSGDLSANVFDLDYRGDWSRNTERFDPLKEIGIIEEKRKELEEMKAEAEKIMQDLNDERIKLNDEIQKQTSSNQSSIFEEREKLEREKDAFYKEMKNKEDLFNSQTKDILETFAEDKKKFEEEKKEHFKMIKINQRKSELIAIGGEIDQDGNVVYENLLMSEDMLSSFTDDEFKNQVKPAYERDFRKIVDRQNREKLEEIEKTKEIPIEEKPAIKFYELGAEIKLGTRAKIAHYPNGITKTIENDAFRVVMGVGRAGVIEVLMDEQSFKSLISHEEIEAITLMDFREKYL